ncbi:MULTISPECIES: polyprenyl synthetase family protein [unclassified Aureimonas]|uniref:polyprenyl synthetase family protein n=1 Tax=unclassified Aureimonas TaxID=2615206 RepID=UPI0006F6A65E|nr:MULTISPECIES: farnesyl diphosphate synthase [unclassified Aureimonas]KQT69929.1 farnesyl-diphosphate synthase [Aureimonas sp. Leaf427]KQT75917.1 farnesyl-diphosphate synthase [Aureimonas sp. Leaf460]
MTTSFETALAARAQAVETRLGEILSPDHPLLAGTPARLLAAMRHGVLNGGKRLRPFLVLESAALFDGDGQAASDVAAALECVHSYSLVHDDLPAMDDDDLRRGQPTVHRAFDEATAILAGDGLLTIASGLVAGAEGASPAARLELVRRLAVQAGPGGMVGGQALDLAAETEDLAEVEISVMQAMKTGALIAFACEAGPILAGAAMEDVLRLRRFGEIVGLAFQLADDLLDETADAAALGKAAGKDRARGKKTLPALHGHDWTRRRLAELVADGTALLAPYGDRAGPLLDAARFIAERTR